VKLNAEMKERDIANLETGKLIELSLKVSGAIQKDCPPVQFHQEETQTLLSTLELDGRKVIKSWEA